MAQVLFAYIFYFPNVFDVIKFASLNMVRHCKYECPILSKNKNGHVRYNATCSFLDYLTKG